MFWNVVATVLVLIAAISGLTSSKGTMESLPWVQGEGRICNVASNLCADLTVVITIWIQFGIIILSLIFGVSD